MARFRSGMALRPINRIKHVVDSINTPGANTHLAITLAIAKDAPVLAVTQEVVTGSKINGFYIKCLITSNEATVAGTPNCYFMVWKNPGGNLTAPSPAAVGGNDNKKWVIHQEMTMIENNGATSNPKTIFEGVVVIPKGMRRMAPNDVWLVQTYCLLLDTSVCLQTIYKEFR